MSDLQSSLKRYAKRSKTAIVWYKIFENWRLRKQFVSGQIETGYGSTHIQKNVAESLDYIELQFNDYLRYSELSLADVGGKKILELGSGDNVGVALSFLAGGAANVVCLDKFQATSDPTQQSEIYRALRNKLPEEQKARFDSAISLENGFEIDRQKLRFINGLTVEQATDQLAKEFGSFDLIISCAVLEEIYDPDPAFAAMDRLLAPGGYLLHKIDLGDYGMFRENGMHPLTFLTIPGAIYRLMASDSALPNRKRCGYYRNKMNELGYQARCFVTNIINEGRLCPYKENPVVGIDYSVDAIALVNEIRPRLDKEFKDSQDNDLAIDGLFLVARKPLKRPVWHAGTSGE